MQICNIVGANSCKMVVQTQSCGGGFTCSKNALITLNVLYILVGSLLISVGVYARAASIITNLPIVGGILACGIILLITSLLGLAGALRHHQVMLFFYMIVLFILFLIQFSIASSCLAVNQEQQRELAARGWDHGPIELKKQVQDTFKCCGFNSTKDSDIACDKSCCSANYIYTPGVSTCVVCEPCLYKLEDTINYSFKLCGGVGLFFSFTEFLGVWLTVRYRNQKDPRGRSASNAFL